MEDIIIQISDLHLFTNSNTKNPDISQFVACLERFLKEDANFYLVICGDLTNDGTENNCMFASKVLSLLESRIKSIINGNLNIIVVPGNHDINLTNTKTNFELIKSLEKDNNIPGLDELYLKEMDKEKYFLNLCRQHDCFKGSYSIDHKKITNLDFVLLNTSGFSSLEKEDKEHHHILSEECFPFRDNLDPKGITILVQHHRNDWLNYYSSEECNEFMNKAVSICLYGHEHNGKEVVVKENQSPEVLFVQSGLMKIKGNRLIGSFNVLEINLEDSTCVVTRFNYDKSKDFFVPEKADGNLYHLTKNIKVFEMPEDIAKSFFSFELNDEQIDLRNIFEMPYLSCNNDEVSDDISSLEEFTKRILVEKKIFIYGPSGCGKTTLIKSAIDELSNKKICLLINGENINSNIKQSLKNAFEDMYGDDKSCFEAFKNRDKSEKVAFIEKLDGIESKTVRNNLVQTLEEEFEYIVISSCDVYEQFKLLFSSGQLSKYIQYTLRGFSISQRESFINKISRLLNVPEEEFEDVIKAVNLSTSLCSVLDLSGPEILLQLTFKVVKDKMYLERNISDAFSLVFEHNINESLCRVGDKESLDDYHCVLRQLAFKIFNDNNSIYFGEEMFLSALREAKNDHSFLKLDGVNTLNLFKQSGLIQKVDSGKYKFHHNSILAYFCAGKISELLKEGEEDILKNICQNITYGINSDVLLFVMYILKDVRIIKQIKDTLKSSLEKSKELNFVTKNITILKKEINYQPETKAQAENRNQMMNRLNSAERRIINKQPSKEERALEPAQRQNEFIESILKGFKLVEILSKAISGFKLQIKDAFRSELIELTISSLLRLLFTFYDFDEEMAEQFQQEFESLKEHVCARLKEDGTPESDYWLKRWQKLTFPTFMYDQLQLIC